MMKKTLSALFCTMLAASFAALAACSRPEEELRAEDVTVSLTPASAELTVDDTEVLSVSVGEKVTGEYTLAYESSEPGVCSVSDSGTVTALKIGSATVTVTLTYRTFEAQDTCTVTVKGLMPAVDLETEYDAVYREGLTLEDIAVLDEGYSWKEGADTPLYAGDGQKFTVVYTPSDGDRYESVETQVTVNVEKAASALAVNSEVAADGVYTMFYTDRAVDIDALGIFIYDGSSTVVYTLKDAGGAEADLAQPLDEGDYTLTASVAETDNYKAASASVAFRVELRPSDLFDRAINGLPEDPGALSETEKAEIMSQYAGLSADEKQAAVPAWNMTRAEKYDEFFDDYVKSVDRGAEDGYFTYFHTAYGPSQVTLGYNITPADGTVCSASFDGETGFADEEATLKVLSSPDWTNTLHFKLGLQNLSWQDATGLDAVFCYVYNGTDDLLMFGQWPTVKPLPAKEWTLVAYPVSLLNGQKGVPAADSFGALSLDIYYYNETADRERLDNGIDVNMTSFTAATPAYVNGLIAGLDKSDPDGQLLRKICDVYYLLSDANRGSVSGFAEIEAMYREKFYGEEAPAAGVVVDFESEYGMAQTGANIQAMAFSSYYPRLAVAPDKEEPQTVTCWENRLGSLTSYYKFEIKINSSLVSDFSGCNVLSFDVYFDSPRNQTYGVKGDNRYYMEYNGKQYVYELNTWYTVRLELPSEVVGTVLTFYAWNVTQTRAACFMMDKIYMTPIKAENFDFAADFAAQVNALDADSTREEIDAVRGLYDALSDSLKEEATVGEAWNKLWTEYYVAPALAELTDKIAAVADNSKEEIEGIIEWYNGLESDLKNEESIKAKYEEFYRDKYAILFEAEFSETVASLSDGSSDEELLAALNTYRAADEEVKAGETIAKAYASLCALIEGRLSQTALIDVSSELALAYNISYTIDNPAEGQTLSCAETAGYADDAAAVKVTISENWNANSCYKMMPQFVNTTGETITVSFYVRSVDNEYRKIRIEKTENGAWKGYATDFYYLEKNTWTFVSFELDAGQSFYVFTQWWKDVNGNNKYMIGYEMTLEFSSFYVSDADYVSGLISAWSGLTDEAKKAEYSKKINDFYGILSEEEKKKVVGYDDFIASGN